MTANTIYDGAAQITASKQRVERLAKLLGDEMSKLHGLDYRVQIDHKPCCEFVLVVPKSGQ